MPPKRKAFNPFWYKPRGGRDFMQIKFNTSPTDLLFLIPTYRISIPSAPISITPFINTYFDLHLWKISNAMKLYSTIAISFICLVTANTLIAQTRVGINTDDPLRTLEVRGANEQKVSVLSTPGVSGGSG
jgi:hypothetical protein